MDEERMRGLMLVCDEAEATESRAGDAGGPVAVGCLPDDDATLVRSPRGV